MPVIWLSLYPACGKSSAILANARARAAVDLYYLVTARLYSNGHQQHDSVLKSHRYYPELRPTRSEWRCFVPKLRQMSKMLATRGKVKELRALEDLRG